MDSTSPAEFDGLLPPAMARRAEDIGTAKAAMPIERLVALSVLGGAFIALGAIFSTVVTAGGGVAPGVSRLLGGLVFSLGLLLVVIGGAELFTGNMLLVMAAASRRIRLRSLLRNWAIVYVGNFVGAAMTAVAVVLADHYQLDGGAIGVRELDIASAKTALGTREAIVLGIFANALVCLAVWLSFSARTTTDRAVAVIPPVAAFVAASFEHSIANMYFVPVGLLVKAWAPPSFWVDAGVSASDYDGLTWGRFVSGNLLPVTIGNVIGGGLLVGLVYWFVYLRRDVTADVDRRPTP
jgi:formate transporter